LYAGADGVLANRFRWLSFALFLPVLAFSAVPFYQSAWKAVKARQPSIDIPVVFGILLGSAASIVNLLGGSSQIYFDSLSTLVSLLLTTRYLLKRAQQSSFSASHLLNFLTPSVVRRISSGGSSEEIPLDQVRAGDRLQILGGDYIPVDGVVLEGKGFVNAALLTGESTPAQISAGSVVFAGTINLEGLLEIQVTGSGARTRLGKILKSVEEGLFRKARILTYSDQVSRFFVIAAMVLSAAVLAWGIAGHWQEGLNRALALAIVTCPCAFALATPLAFSEVIGRFAKAGILIKGSEVIERLSQVREVFLDKTGTLTSGTPVVMNWDSKDDAQARQITDAAVLALESNSRHPVAKALVRRLEGTVRAAPQLTHFVELLGHGVSGRVGADFYEVVRAATSSSDQTVVSVRKNGSEVAAVYLGDQLREDSTSAVKSLRRLELRTWILSRDLRGAVSAVAASVGIPGMSVASERTPEQKRDLVFRHPFSLMVGDGANDSIALAEAHVGIAVHSGAEVSLRAADIYLSTPGVAPVSRLITVSRETMRVIRRNFRISLLYNLIAGTAALLGKIDPLFAAVLMPVSSLSVIASSLLGTRKMRAVFKEMNP
ncbi:MAG: heavy metal translocating P-type ATPase, partial [Bdellovibrionota bacterium]